MRRFNFQTLGRLKTGERNKTEKAFENYLHLLHKTGEILWFKFESIKLRLADNTFFTVDFFVVNKNNELEAYEVKGSKFIFQDDAKVKIKVAAETFPFKFFVVYPQKGGAWEINEV